jgi:hypothetical protein
VGVNQLVYQGIKIGFGSVLYVQKPRSILPPIEGLSTSGYTVLPVTDDSLYGNSPVFVGNSTITLDSCLRAQSIGKQTCIVSDTFLNAYDSSVEQSITMQLRRIRIATIRSAPCSTKQISDGGLVKLEFMGSQRSIQTDSLFVEPLIRYDADIGLLNHEHTIDHSGTTWHRNILTIPNDSNLDLSQCQQISKLLRTGKGKLPSIHTETVGLAGNARLISIGIREQDIYGTLSHYRRSIVRVPVAGSELHGFIKFLTTRSRKILGISGILPPTYQLTILRHMVKHKLPFGDIFDLTDASDLLSSELIDAYESLS